MNRRTVLITGASSGIGKAIARELVAKGDFPILVARDDSKLQNLKQELGAGSAFACDVTKEEDVHRLVRRVIQTYGGLDVLINNAGYGRFGGSMDIPIADYAGMAETNYLGTVRMTQAFLPHLLSRNGRIINIASIAGLTGIPNLAAYCASKFAIMGYSESLQLEFSPRIRVGVLCPGPVQTPFFQGEDPSSLFPPLISGQLLDTETVARHAVRLIERPRVHVIPFGMRWAMRFRRFCPGLYGWMLKRIYDSFGQKKPAAVNHEERVP
ncbi:SDR family NAD(P)-dependent oxidoreductase [Desmospora profundinema]|uniref:Short-subunit dehydrogenase n=1 Tax=Desmospora profundinema TaxID=1571184 RepID=A0ABU1IR35_9BACL|nr:SDR family NAD(P)-dependent oxidoreductase [Desmospora profundinema]MDR6227166.1 short-subunit dehydrogenase [Desmospora profundinema]